MSIAYHDPVLRDEALGFLVTDESKVYVDATVGGGGHAEAICRRLHGTGRLICFDADSDAIAAAKERLAPYQGLVSFVHSNFGNVELELRARSVEPIHGLLLDLGVSSFQLDQAGKGFSFRVDERIDMRIDRRQTVSGWDVVNTYTEHALADILWQYGEERHARRIARRIVESRAVDTTGVLRDIVASAVGGRFLNKSLSRVFQAIRIEVNGELKNLQKVLDDSLRVLSPHGRIVVISYHSLEDRIVKDFFRKGAAAKIPSGHVLLADTPVVPRLRVLTKKPVTPTASEMRRNPRARSAKMRVAERLLD